MSHQGFRVEYSQTIAPVAMFDRNGGRHLMTPTEAKILAAALLACAEEAIRIEAGWAVNR